MHSSGGDEQPGEADDGLTIGAVSRLLGVPAPTIRSWERRYSLPTGRHRTAGQRRYTRADVQALSRMRAETSRGRGAAEAAALVISARESGPGPVVDLLLAAAHRFDSRALHGALEAARRTHGLAPTLEEVVLPALRRIGTDWAEGRSDAAQEHLLTDTVQCWLFVEQQQAPAPTRPGPVVLACGPGDQHTLALQSLAVLLAHQGFDCRYLGARTPVPSLTLAVRRTAARAVVLTCHLDQTRPAAVAALRAVAALQVGTYYAGAGFTTVPARRGIPGSYLGESLSAAASRISSDADRPADAAPRRPADQPGRRSSRPPR